MSRNMWHGDQYGPGQDAINSLSAENADLHNDKAAFAALLGDAACRLHGYRQRCHCYSQMATCPRCAGTLELEHRIHAALDAALAGSPKEGT
jgi:hypothetical protein